MTYLLAAYAAIWFSFIAYLAVFMVKSSGLKAQLAASKRPEGA